MNLPERDPCPTCHRVNYDIAYTSEWTPEDEAERHVLFVRTLRKMAVKALNGSPGTWIDLDKQDVQIAIDDTFVLGCESAQSKVYQHHPNKMRMSNATCECTMYIESGTKHERIEYCPLHRAAPKLLRALKLVEKARCDGFSSQLAIEADEAVKEAITQAEGKP